VFFLFQFKKKDIRIIRHLSTFIKYIKYYSQILMPDTCSMLYLHYIDLLEDAHATLYLPHITQHFPHVLSWIP